jgi:hypothetical protein
MPIMRNSRLFAAGIATAVILVVLSGLSGSLLAQRHAAPVIAQVKPLGHPCNLMTDPFPGRLAEAELPPGLIPVDAKTRSDILTSGLPCAETVNPTGQTDNPKGGRGNRAGKSAARLRFLFVAEFHRAEFPRRRKDHRSIAAEHADKMGGYGQFQAASRHHVACQDASTEMADR